MTNAEREQRINDALGDLVDSGVVTEAAAIAAYAVLSGGNE